MVSSSKSSFFDKVLGRIDRLGPGDLQTVVRQLARERAFLETLFNTIEDGVLVVDDTGCVLYLNQAVTHLLGLKLEGAEGQSLTRLLPEVDWSKLSTSNREGGQRVVRHEFEVTYPRPRFLSLYVTPLEGDAASHSRLALILHDVTETRQKTFAAIESERVQALTLLAASVAHEIGNPLNALSIHLQLMEREFKKLKTSPGAATVLEKVTGSRKKSRPRNTPNDVADAGVKLDRYLEVCKGEITRLDYIVTQFLQAIRPVPPHLKPVSLNEVVRETLSLLQPEMENRGVTVKEKLARRLPLAPLDPVQIKQVLVNLIKNALQAMTKGGVLTLQTDAGADGVFVSVADTGGGIPSEQIKRIFEPFYTTRKKGTGLGLMIVQRIVREHGGRIELESHVGQGTVFRIWLPLHEKQIKLLEARHD